MLCPLAAASAPAGGNTHTSDWQADLDHFATQLPAGHKDFYQLMPRDSFEREVAAIRAGVPRLSDAEIILRLDRLVSRLRIAHTQVHITSGSGARAFRHYPVKLRWFKDELAVVSAAREYRDALGCRVLRIGPMTPERAETVVAPYVPYENQAHLRRRSPGYMGLVEVMQRERIADAAGHLKLTCARVDGTKVVFDLPPQASAAASPKPADPEDLSEPALDSGRKRRTGRKLLSAQAVLHIPPLFCHKHGRQPYWYEYLPDTGTLYIQYNTCHDAPSVPFTGFLNKLFASADSQPVQRVIVDLRFNGGGDSGAADPLIQGLKSRSALSTPGRLYVLIGGGTFSSAMITAHHFRTRLHALLVGEPSGNKPNHYGNVSSFVLPHSGLKVSYSRKRIQLFQGDGPESLEPDIFVPETLADYRAGCDRALETALGRRK